MTDIRTSVSDLFRYLDEWERGSGEFETEGFLQTYQGLYAVFEALRQQRNKAIELDQYFLELVKQIPINASDLRLLTLQILVSYFESEADVDGQSNQSYSYCRGLRQIRQDVPYFESYLMPLLLKDGSLRDNFRLNKFFVTEISRFMKRFGQPLDGSTTPEDFAALSDPGKILRLARRRLEFGAQLLDDRTSLEHQLQQLKSFEKLKLKGRLCEAYLLEWKYLQTTSFWSLIKVSLLALLRKIGAAGSSSRYVRLTLTQRTPAYLFYGAVMILMLWLAIMTPLWWRSFDATHLKNLTNHADSLGNP